MKLTELEPKFFRYEVRTETWETVNGPKTGPREYRIPVKELGEAQCVQFLCPKCFAEWGSNYGVHYVEVTFSGRGVPNELGTHNRAGNPTRWAVSGNNFSDLTTQPSILLEGGCNWHGFLTNGDAN